MEKNLQVTSADAKNDDDMGLFGKTDGATITELGLVNVNVLNNQSRGGNIGGLVGSAISTTIDSCYVTGNVGFAGKESYAEIGGLVGYMEKSTITNCYNDANVTIADTVGASYNDGIDAGGIVGKVASGDMKYCYNTGTISSKLEKNKSCLGGLIGLLTGNVYHCYNVGTVSKTDSENGNAAGLIGSVQHDSALESLYNLSGVALCSFYRSESDSGLFDSKGKSVSMLEMKQAATYTGWDFTNVWYIDAMKNNGYPVLYSLLPRAEEPVSNYKSGACNVKFEVTLSDAIPNSTIYYTLDGTTPDTTSMIYSGPIPISKTTKLRAIAVASGFRPSEVAEYKYDFELYQPRGNVSSGKFNKAFRLKLHCDDENAIMYYTTNGTKPTTSSEEYQGYISVRKSMVIKVIAVDHLAKSSVKTFRFTKVKAKKKLVKKKTTVKKKKTGTKREKNKQKIKSRNISKTISPIEKKKIKRILNKTQFLQFTMAYSYSNNSFDFSKVKDRRQVLNISLKKYKANQVSKDLFGIRTNGLNPIFGDWGADCLNSTNLQIYKLAKKRLRVKCCIKQVDNSNSHYGQIYCRAEYVLRRTRIGKYGYYIQKARHYKINPQIFVN